MEELILSNLTLSPDNFDELILSNIEDIQDIIIY